MNASATQLSSSPRDHSSARWWSVLLILLIVTISALAASCLVIASFPVHSIESYLLRFSTSGQTHLPPGTLERMRFRLGIAGAIFAATAIASVLRFGTLVRRTSPTAERIVQSSLVWSQALAADVRAAGKGRAVVVLLFCIGAGAVRIHFLNQPMRLDETVTYLTYASKPLFITVSNYAEPNNHLLNTVMVWASTRVFGNHPWAIRLPALVSGLALVPLIYVVGLRLYTANVGLIAAGMVAASSYLVEFSTNARGYTVQSTLLMLSLLLAHGVKKRAGMGVAIACAIATALGFYALPTMVYGYSGILLWLAISAIVEQSRAERRKQAIDLAVLVIAVIAFTALLYSPVLLTRGLSSITSNVYVLPRSMSYFFAAVGPMAWRIAQDATRDLPTVFAGLLILMAATSVAWQTTRFSLASDRVAFFPLMVVSSFICILLQRVVPYNRVWVLVLPPLYLTAAAGIVETFHLILARRWEWAGVLVVSAIGVWWGVRVWTGDSVLASPESSMREGPLIASWMQSHLQPEDCMEMPNVHRMPVVYYLEKAGVDKSYVYDGPRAVHGRVWLVQYEPLSPLATAMAELRVANPRLSEPKLQTTIGHANIYLVTALPSADE